MAQDVEWGWRLSLGLAAVPATVFFVGSCMLDDSPNSLLLNHKAEKGHKVGHPAAFTGPHEVLPGKGKSYLVQH